MALIEMGFMTNKTEDKQMQKKQTQKKMVDGIANGIDQYFKIIRRRSNNGLQESRRGY